MSEEEAKVWEDSKELFIIRGSDEVELPSALATARVIEDLSSVAYPEGIKSPKVELNLNAKQGKFRYDRDFLLQFMAICKEKPDSLPPLDAIGLEPSDQSYAMSRGGSGRRTSSASMPPPPSTAARQAVGLGISGFQKPTSNPFTMGQFATGDTKMTSAERFAMSNNRSSSVSGGAAGMPFGRPPPMVRSSSQGGPGGAPMGSNRKRSQRGTKRPTDDRQNTGSSGQGSSYASSSLAAQAALSMEPVAPLEVSANRWQPNSIAKKPQAPDSDSPEVVDRKVRGLLNKLTMERFDSISDQIISWANRSEREKDGRTLIQVIRLVFEKATDEARLEMYARLCRKMMEQISPKVQDDGIKNSEGKPIAGGQLFRKYLLNRCRKDFERGWAAKDATAVAAATKATEDKAAKDAADKNEDEGALYSEEYYAAQKAKRQCLGLIRFFGELFKVQMLTERIMHECVKKLLGNVENHEEEIESLCKLLTTVGQILDTQKAHVHMDVYFSRMKELCKSPNVNSRMQSMLQDIIELRERKWIPRNAVAAPTTLAAVHEASAKDRAAVEKETHNRMNNMSRGGSRRGGDRGDHSQVGPDGWSVASSAALKPPPPTKAGDLTNFGKITKRTSMSFGPSSVFQGKKGEKSRDSTMTRSMSQNMFNALRENPELAADAGSKSSRPPSRKPSVDFGTAGVPDPSRQRRKLNLFPCSKLVEEAKTDSTPVPSETNSEGDTPNVAGPSMAEAEAKTRVKEDSKELFSIRDLGGAELYFTKLPSEHRWRLVDHLVSSAIESKESDAQLVGDFFSRAVAKNQCSPASFEEGFTQVAENLDDIVIDAPKAFSLMAIVMKGARLDTDEERRTRLASKFADSDQLLSLLS
ncbi:ARM repeat-containing protein [Amylocystis lapponica]|nr:ARM repeat-containing protein [Amylocystis lapponica]